MPCTAIRCLLVACLCLVATACVAEPDPVAADDAGFDTESAALTALSPLYWGMPVTLVTGAKDAKPERTFGAAAGKTFQITATAARKGVTVTLWRKRGSGWTWLKQASGAKVVLTHTPNSDGTFRVRFEPGKIGQALQVSLGCSAGAGACALAGQPGEACSKSGKACDAGLFCKLPVGACSQGGPVGTCVFLPTVCPTAPKLVCGCDGKTWMTDCSAASAGVSVASPSACGGQP